MSMKFSAEQKRIVAERLGFSVHDGQVWLDGDPVGGAASEEAGWERAFEECVLWNKLYLHKKGGIYRVLNRDVRHADGGTVVLYEHLWPHERALWVRNQAEFDEPGRFERI
jgi:hypothetical protein